VKHIFLFTLLTIGFYSGGAQHSNSFLRLFWANDFTIKKDMYESNVLTFTHFSSGSSLTRFLLPGTASSFYGYGLDHGIYTPYRKKFVGLVDNDHPYGGTLSVSFSRLSVANSGSWVYYTAISAGVLGPASGAEEIQSGIHSLLPSTSVPKGWDNQLSNRAIVNYRLEATRRLYRAKSFEAAVRGSGTLGSPRTFIDPGIILRFGKVDDDFFGRVPFISESVRIYAAFEASVVYNFENIFHDYIGLQTERVYGQGRLSASASYKNWMLTVGQSLNTPQFKEAQWHGHGSFDIYISF